MNTLIIAKEQKELTIIDEILKTFAYYKTLKIQATAHVYNALLQISKHKPQLIIATTQLKGTKFSDFWELMKFSETNLVLVENGKSSVERVSYPNLIDVFQLKDLSKMQTDFSMALKKSYCTENKNALKRGGKCLIMNLL